MPYDLVLDKECPFDSLASLCNEMVKQRLSQEYQLVDRFYDVEKYKKMVASRSKGYSVPSQAGSFIAPGGMGVYHDHNQNQSSQQQQRIQKRDTSTSSFSTNSSSGNQSTNWINQVMSAITGQHQQHTISNSKFMLISLLSYRINSNIKFSYQRLCKHQQ